MMPMMRSITLLRTSVEKKKMTAITAMAPMKAASRMAAKPLTLTEPMERPPPRKSMTRATPRPAPLLMPKMLGPARGLRKAVCSIRPLTASEAPQKTAVMACGRRDCRTMNCQELFSEVSPIKIRNTSLAGIETDPSNKFSTKSSRISAPKPIQ